MFHLFLSGWMVFAKTKTFGSRKIEQRPLWPTKWTKWSSLADQFIDLPTPTYRNDLINKKYRRFCTFDVRSTSSLYSTLALISHLSVTEYFVFMANFVGEWNTYIFIYSFDRGIARTDRVVWLLIVHPSSIFVFCIFCLCCSWRRCLCATNTFIASPTAELCWHHVCCFDCTVGCS